MWPPCSRRSRRLWRGPRALSPPLRRHRSDRAFGCLFQDRRADSIWRSKQPACASSAAPTTICMVAGSSGDRPSARIRAKPGPWPPGQAEAAAAARNRSRRPFFSSAHDRKGMPPVSLGAQRSPIILKTGSNMPRNPREISSMARSVIVRSPLRRRERTARSHCRVLRRFRLEEPGMSPRRRALKQLLTRLAARRFRPGRTRTKMEISLRLAVAQINDSNLIDATPVSSSHRPTLCVEPISGETT